MKKIWILLLASFLLMTGCSRKPDEAAALSTPVESESDIAERAAAIADTVVESMEEPAAVERQDQAADDTLHVRLTFDGGEALVSLEDNVAARSWYAQLPMTQTFEDFHEREKICRIPDEISTVGMEIGNVPKIGDISLYIPWNTLVFYYDSYDGNDSSVPIGRVESGLDLLMAMGEEFLVTMEPVQVSADVVQQEGTAPSQSETTDITMTVGDTVITATLDDSETSREFLATLPRTISMSRYADREYYGRIESISTRGEEIDDFSDGDVTFYVPGPSLAIFFANEDQSSLSGLIRMGRITSELSDIDALEDAVEVYVALSA